jgi:hypothetical protein
MRKVGHRQSIYAAAGSNNFLIGQDMILVHVLHASLEAAAAVSRRHAGGEGHTEGLFASLATSMATTLNFERPVTASQEDTVDLTFNA